MDIREVLDHLDRRFDDRERHDALRHSDLVRRIENMDNSVAKAHGRISTHDGILSRLERRIEQVGERYHALSNRMTRVIQDQIQVYVGKLPAAATGDNQYLSRIDAKWIITLIIGSVVGTLAVLRFIGKLG